MVADNDRSLLLLSLICHFVGLHVSHLDPEISKEEEHQTPKDSHNADQKPTESFDGSNIDLFPAQAGNSKESKDPQAKAEEQNTGNANWKDQYTKDDHFEKFPLLISLWNCDKWVVGLLIYRAMA